MEDDKEQLEYVTNSVKNPDEFIKKVTYLYEHPYEKSRDEIELTDGTVLDRFSSSVPGEDGTNYGRIWTFHDITERKRALEEVQKSRDLLTNLAQLVPGVIYQYRLNPNGSSAFPYSNSGMNDIYEFTPEEVQEDATPVFSRLHPDDHDRVASDIYESARTLNVFQCSYRVNLPKQGLRWMWSQVQPERMPDGGTLWHGIILDITEREQAEEKLRQSEKMSAIGQLAGGIAHDFNNQLTSVIGYVDLLLDHLDDETLSRYATNIKKGAKRAAELTAQLLAFSRKGKNLSLPVEMHKVLTEVASILEHTIDKRIKIHQTLNASPAITTGDPNQLQNAILNMALNARDAMPEGGELIFETDIVELDEQFCKGHPYEVSPGMYLKVSITDTGCGMDAETQKHLFEPFYTTKEVGKGTGMGLASAYGTVRNHKGAISFYSEVGHGSTFRIYLPVSQDDCNKQKEDDRDQIIKGTAKILVVEDEEMVRLLVVDILKMLGYTVISTKNGVEAIECYKKFWKEIDLVVLDMIMPEMDGGDAFLEMRKINPDIKAILSSGYSINGNVQKILDYGIKAFVGKPFNRVELSETISRVLLS